MNKRKTAIIDDRFSELWLHSIAMHQDDLMLDQTAVQYEELVGGWLVKQSPFYKYIYFTILRIL